MMRPVEVVLVVTRFQAGAGVVALRGALALDQERYHHTVIAGRGDHLLEQAADAGMDVIVRPELVPEIDPRNDVRALRSITAVLRSRSVDVVHTHSAKAGVIGRLAARRAGVPRVVHTFHGFPWHEFQSPARRGAYVAIERRLARSTDAFLAVGTAVAAEAIRRGLATPEQIWAVDGAMDVAPKPATPENRRSARAVLGLPPHVAVVGTVGRLDHQKAPRDFVTAIAASTHRDLVGVWIGDGPLRNEVAAHARALGVADRIVLTGQRTDVADVLPAFDVFAMSSLYEGLPCAVLEAMACGLPVVATAVNAVPDVVTPGRTGLLVPPRAPELLAGAIDHLLREPARAEQLARAGREALGSRFDIRGLATALEQSYAAQPMAHVLDLSDHRTSLPRTSETDELGELAWRAQS
jgi:glycosyltransferase involved in cell wall biosynthesis